MSNLRKQYESENDTSKMPDEEMELLIGLLNYRSCLDFLHPVDSRPNTSKASKLFGLAQVRWRQGVTAGIFDEPAGAMKNGNRVFENIVDILLS